MHLLNVEFYVKVEYLLTEWVRLFHQPISSRDSEKLYAAYLGKVGDQMCLLLLTSVIVFLIAHNSYISMECSSLMI